MEQVFELIGNMISSTDISEDTFYDKFIEFVELNKWYFGGGTNYIEELKSLEIDGCISADEKISRDFFMKQMSAFIESEGWKFNGEVKEVIDGYYINKDGTKGKYAL